MFKKNNNNLKFSRERGVKLGGSREKGFKLKGNGEKKIDIKGFFSSIKLKWWHILLIALGVALIIGGIVTAVVLGRGNDSATGDGGDPVNPEDYEETPPETEGTITATGTYVSTDTEGYILCEYTELFSGEKVILLQKVSDVRYDYKAHYVFVSDTGELDYGYSGEYTGEYTPEEIKQDLFSLLKSVLGYTDETLAKSDMVVYEPVSFTKVKISEVTLAEDNTVTLKYSAGAIDGEMSEEYTLEGTYVKTENDFAFTFTNPPEDELLLDVAGNVLKTAKYKYYAQYGRWVNALTFGDTYTLYMQAEQTNAE